MKDWLDAFQKWVGIIITVALLNFGERYRASRLSVFFTIFEPIGVIIIFTILHSLSAANPPFGSSTVLFYATGILPFYLFFHVSLRIRRFDFFPNLPGVSLFDFLVSYAVDEFLTKFIIMTAVFSALYACGIKDAIPRDPGGCLAPTVLLLVLGLAIGTINGVIARFFTGWLYIYAILIRLGMAFSGVMYVVDLLPVSLREWVVLNPVTHGLGWFRWAFYGHYPSNTLDRGYLLHMTMAAMAVSYIVLHSGKRGSQFR